MKLLYVLAVVFWILGYFATTRAMSNPGKGGDMDRIIFPPKWIYFLCGAPAANEYPRGTMKAGALLSQMWGLALGIYATITLLWKPSRIEFLVGFAFIVGLPMILSYYFSNQYAVNNQVLKKKKGK